MREEYRRYDAPIRHKVRRMRLAWILKKFGKQLPANFNDLARSSLQDVSDYKDARWFWDLIFTRHLESGWVRGERCWVEDVEQHGWTLLDTPFRTQAPNQFERLWVKNSWEDPAGQGHLTTSEDPSVIAAERMARAWDMGLDWDMDV